jgi:transposase
VLLPRQQAKLLRGTKDKEHAISQTPNTVIAVIGIDIGKNSFHVVGHDARGAIVLRQKWSRGQVEARLANIPPCLIGMEACVGAHHLSRKLASLGHDARLMPAKYVRPYGKGQKNDFNDADAIAEAVQRPTMKFVATKTAEQLDLQALHRVRERSRADGKRDARWVYQHLNNGKMIVWLNEAAGESHATIEAAIADMERWEKVQTQAKVARSHLPWERAVKLPFK